RLNAEVNRNIDAFKDLIATVARLCRHRHDSPGSSYTAMVVVGQPSQRVAGKDGFHASNYSQDSPGPPTGDQYHNIIIKQCLEDSD
ncbi:hypothetical protein FQN60_018408, partial [Etheostoma spectabile]